MPLFHSKQTILLLAGLLSTSVSAQAAPSLRLDSLTVPAGSEALLTVSLNEEVADLCGLMLSVRYDAVMPAAAPPLDLVGLNERRLGPAFAGSLYGSAAPRDDWGLPLDRQRRIAIVHGEPVNGPAVVIQLPFRVPEAAPPQAVYQVTVTAVANDPFGVKFPVEGATGTVTVSGVSPAPGDVNGNGSVDVGDAILTLRASVGLITLTAAQQLRADMNRNGTPEIADAVAILRLSVGLGNG